MKTIYIQVDENNRVLGYGYPRSMESEIEVEVNEEHEVLKIPFAFKYIDGELIKDDEYLQKRRLDKIERINNSPEKMVKLLKEQNSNLAYELMLSDYKVRQIAKSNSDLFFELMSKQLI